MGEMPHFFRGEADDLIIQGQEGNTGWGINLSAVKRVIDEAPDEYVIAGARNWRAAFGREGLTIQRRVAEVYEEEVIARAQANYPQIAGHEDADDTAADGAS